MGKPVRVTQTESLTAGCRLTTETGVVVEAPTPAHAVQALKRLLGLGVRVVVRRG